MDVALAWIVFALVALIATLSVTDMVRVFAHRLRAVDSPGGRRVHRRPTARLGGLGIYWGFYVAMALATYGHPSWSDPFHGEDVGMIGMMLGSGLLLLVGVADDVYGLRATAKLVCQFVARSEEHTSELQSRFDLVCRLLLEKKNKRNYVW